MGGNILTKENFVELVMKEQERKKESGIKLTKMDDTSFYNLLTEVLLEFGGETKKETPKSTEVKETKKRVRKQNKIIVEQIVVDKDDSKTNSENDIVFGSEVVKVIETTKKKTKKVQKIETKVVKEVKTKVKKEKDTEIVFKTKDIPRKDGLMQIAFDF